MRKHWQMGEHLLVGELISFRALNNSIQHKNISIRTAKKIYHAKLKNSSKIENPSKIKNFIKKLKNSSKIKKFVKN
jgi:hypothetical protein